MEFIVPYFLLLITSCYGIENQLNGLGYKSVSKYGRFDASICSMEATCRESQSNNQNLTCFGTELPYSVTSLALAEDSESLFDVQDNLALWQGLRSIPRCWAVVQPLLCSVYMPKCENGSVSLPSQEMCRITRGPCKAVEKKHSWPSFLRCENKKLFPPRCRNPVQEIKFNASYKCIPPLVETDNSDIWYEDVDGCAMQCQNPFYSEKEHDYTHFIIAISFSLALIANVLATITLGIPSKASRTLPMSVLLYTNICLIVTSLGWLAQFIPGLREIMVCNPDGTMQQQQPTAGRFFCIAQFIAIYFSSMAAITWCVILKFTVYVQIRNSGSKDTLKKHSLKLKLIGWTVPSVLSSIIISLKAVDGDSMSGICLVGYAGSNTRLFLILPVVFAGVFVCIIFALCFKNMKSQEMHNDAYRKKLQHWKNILRIISGFCLLIIIGTLSCHTYDFLHRDEWEESLREFIVCLAKNSGNLFSELSNECSLKSKPNIHVLHFHIICMVGFSILMSSWTWHKDSLKTWKRHIFRCCSPKDRSSKVKKHLLISEVFRKRHQINRGGISLSGNSLNEDPVGINLDGSSVASGSITSSWARSFPQLMWRRNAVPNIMPYAPRQYSSASDISRHVSMDSYNQQNIDSQSLQISEQEYVLRHQRRKTRKERMRLWKTHRWFPSTRRNSDTSLQSSLAASIVAATAKNAGVKISKSTSTGDLINPIPIIPPSVIPPIIVPQPVTTQPVPRKSTIQREPVNLPFTHGMTDNSHRLEHRNLQSSMGTASVRLTPNPSTVGVNVRFTPNPMINGYQNPLNTLIQPSMFGQGFDYMNTMPYGYMGGMCPGIFSTYSTSIVNPNFNYQLYGNLGYIPYDSYQTNDAMLNQYQPNLLPVHPRAESASETEYFPIIMSDSEFTDTGHRSYDEAQLMTTRLLQERAQALAAAAAQSESQHHKIVLEPQECAKIQFLKRMDTCKIQTSSGLISEPINDRQSPHNEAPPPSPADSVKSLDVDEDDDVFECSVNEEKKTTSMSSLPQNVEDESIMQKLKSKFRRAISFSKNGQEPPEGLELSVKPCFNSSDNISSHNEPLPVKNTQNEKCLDASESLSLMDGNENVSR